VLGFFSHFFIETLHSACDGARAKSPNVFLGASTAQLQIPFTVLTTLLKDAQMPYISSKRQERVQATASSLCCACLHAYASLPAPVNQFDILRDALRRMRLNIAILLYNTISQVVGCDLALTGSPICDDSGC
jgi:hypothetical protein